MKNFTLATIAFILTSSFAHADGKAFCVGTGSRVQVSITLRSNDQDRNQETFNLHVQREGAPAEDFSGTAKIGGGDGMFMATLNVLSEEGRPSEIGTMSWWVAPSMKPSISFTGSSNSIFLKCKNLFEQITNHPL